MRAPILLLLLCALCHGAERPNILFIYLDDFGWRDTSYAGSDFYETPHLDRLAAQGMVFSDAYAGAANCAPSRACMLSGQYSPRHEIYNGGKPAPVEKASIGALSTSRALTPLRPDIITWAECARKIRLHHGQRWVNGT